jgi:hypothetical protein
MMIHQKILEKQVNKNENQYINQYLNEQLVCLYQNDKLNLIILIFICIKV